MTRLPVISSLAMLAAMVCNPVARGDDQSEDLGRTRYHMRQQLSDLRTIERLLVAGRLDEAKAVAFFFTRSTGPAGTKMAESRDIALAAGSLANARTVDEALRHEVRIAAACAACHQRAQRLPVFRAPTNAPRDLPTVAAQMARHQWAADRLWEGLVAASDEHWRVALDAIATTLIPEPVRPTPDSLGKRLRKQARAALASNPPLSADERATAYGEILVTCASCHALQRPDRPVQSSARVPD